MTLIAILIVLVFLHSLVSGRLERSVVTAPILFTSAGMLTLFFLEKFPDQESERTVFLHLAEVGLVLLLFTDASRTDLGVLKNIRNLPARLLSTGMLLTLLLGGLCALVVFRQLSIWEAGILAAILAPTDAGAGAGNRQQPARADENPPGTQRGGGTERWIVRAVPAVFHRAGRRCGEGEHARLTKFIIEQLSYGTLVSLGIGGLGGWLLGLAHRRNWMAHSRVQLGVVAVPVLCLLASEKAGASMFIAAFVAGLAVQIGFKEAAKHSVEFTEEWGQLFNLSVFFLFGLLVARAWTQFNWLHVAYAVLSLTIVRMLPVAIALIGTRLSRATVLFMGWFGPRGLASIVLGLVYLEQHTHQTGESTIRLAVMVTVLLSIFAHGLSALPGMEVYARKLSALPPDAPELAGAEAGDNRASSTAGPAPNH